MKIAAELSKLPIIDEINEFKAEVDHLRPLSKEVEQRILQKFRLEWNYNSNAIEGNTLNYGETAAFLMHGITAKGKPFKDYLDIKGHNQAIDFLLAFVSNKDELTETDIRGLHKVVLVEPYEVKTETPSGLPSRKVVRLGEYKQQPNHVKTATGETHYYAAPEETQAKMQELMGWYRKSKTNIKIHPLVLASLFHHQFVAIHPFDDGNGRMARLLMNLILMQYQFPPIVVKHADRQNYYLVLSQADTGDYIPLIDYFGNLLKDALNIYLKGAKGETIEEPSDIDKEIALFKASLHSEPQIKIERSQEAIQRIIKISVFPLFRLLQEKCRTLDELFFEHNDRILYGSQSQEMKRVLITQNWNAIEENWLNGLNFWTDEIHAMKYEYSWKGFKRAKEPFDIDLEVPVNFDRFKYRFNQRYSKRTKIDKFYHELLIQEEMNLLIKEIIGQVMDDIKSIAKV